MQIFLDQILCAIREQLDCLSSIHEQENIPSNGQIRFDAYITNISVTLTVGVAKKGPLPKIGQSVFFGSLGRQARVLEA